MFFQKTDGAYQKRISFSKLFSDSWLISAEDYEHLQRLKNSLSSPD